MDYNEAYHYLNFKIGGDNGLKMLMLLADDKSDDGINFIQELTQCDDNTAQKLWLELKDKYGASETNCFTKEKKEYKIQQSIQNKPKCPICGSTNLSKITTTKKVMKIVAFGIFGMGDNGKTWKCNNCDSKF